MPSCSRPDSTSPPMPRSTTSGRTNRPASAPAHGTHDPHWPRHRHHPIPCPSPGKQGRLDPAALSTARKQGYQYVIASHDFDSSTTATVHTGTYTIPTSAGDITVLSEQKELGDLAKGKPTSSDADGETSNAGRIARFVAQSAFYQMEQPYAAMNRNLLVCFGTNMSAAFIDTLMTAVEQSSWLQLTDLNDLIGADAIGPATRRCKSSPKTVI